MGARTQRAKRALEVTRGQLLSSRPDLLPDVYIEELGRLVEEVPPVPFAELEPVIRRATFTPSIRSSTIASSVTCGRTDLATVCCKVASGLAGLVEARANLGVGEPKGSSSPLRERAAAPTVPSPALV